MSSATLSGLPTEIPVTTDPTVVMCYKLLAIAQLDDTLDYTDGKYFGDYRSDRASYLRAQAAQAEYLLDQVKCANGSRLFDIGCGYGRILEAAASRGAKAVGITISQPQLDYCVARNMDVRLLDYRNIPADWKEKFSCLVANGSLEHFVQVSDAVSGRADDIYHHMFEICRRLISKGDRFATTAIHLREANQVDPDAIARGHQVHPKGSDEYHFCLMNRFFGGWYPEPGQLARCADGFFRLTEEEEGTSDYRETAEYWLRRGQRAMLMNPRFLFFIAQRLITSWRPTIDMLRCLVTDQSWMWQFRGENPPTRLYRHTWEAV